jgi:hypothetical protein
MPFDKLVPRPFTLNGISMYAPTVSGVFGISNAREWLYIGEGDNIQAALLNHLGDLYATFTTREPHGFVFEACVFEACEVTRRPARLDRLVLEYEPSCQRRPASLLMTTSWRKSS